MKNTKFYICPHCGKIVELVNDAGPKPFCCGQKMNELIPNTAEASGEKHIPAGNVGKNIVEGTDKGSYSKWLNPGEAPNVKFLLGEEKPLEVYAYCNLHGLWKTELN